jgi:hypothetical protein
VGAPLALTSATRCFARRAKALADCPRAQATQSSSSRTKAASFVSIPRRQADASGTLPASICASSSGQRWSAMPSARREASDADAPWRSPNSPNDPQSS